MPVLLAGLAATAIGTGLEVAGNAQDQSAINSAINTETQKQKGYQNQAFGVLNQNLAKQGAPAAQTAMGAGEAARENLTANLANAAQPATPTPTSASPDVATQEAQARASTAGNAWTKLATQAQAREGSYGDWGTALGIGNTETNSNLGVINNFARGTAALLPLQVQAAAHRGDPLSGWGSIISAIGSVASLAGATGAIAPAAAGAGTAANAPLSVVNTPSIWSSMIDYANP